MSVKTILTGVCVAMLWSSQAYGLQASGKAKKKSRQQNRVADCPMSVDDAVAFARNMIGDRGQVLGAKRIKNGGCRLRVKVLTKDGVVQWMTFPQTNE